MKPRPPQKPVSPVTDHALIRWLERVHGMDMESFRSMIEAEIKPFLNSGVTNVQINGLWYAFAGGRLVTISPNRSYRIQQDKAPVAPVQPEPQPWQMLKRRRRHV